MQSMERSYGRPDVAQAKVSTWGCDFKLHFLFYTLRLFTLQAAELKVTFNPSSGWPHLCCGAACALYRVATS